MKLGPALILCAIAFAAFAFAPEAQADPKLTRTRCLEGDAPERARQAREIFSNLARGADPAGVLLISELTVQASLPRFEADLGTQMRRRRCGFKGEARFSTVDEVRLALAEHWFKEEPRADVPAYIKPGFVALIGTPSSNDIMAVETTEDGFVFRVCKVDAGLQVGKRCAPFGNTSVFVPVDDFLDRSSGFKRELVGILRVVAGLALIGTTAISEVSLPFLIVPATTVTQELIKPDALAAFRRQQATKKVTEEILLMGKFDAEAAKKGMVTRLIPFAKFTDLETAIMSLVMESLTHEWKQLKKLKGLPLKASSAYALQYGFHQQAMEFYAQEKAAKL